MMPEKYKKLILEGKFFCYNVSVNIMFVVWIYKWKLKSIEAQN